MIVYRREHGGPTETSLQCILRVQGFSLDEYLQTIKFNASICLHVPETCFVFTLLKIGGSCTKEDHFAVAFEDACIIPVDLCREGFFYFLCGGLPTVVLGGQLSNWAW